MKVIQFSTSNLVLNQISPKNEQGCPDPLGQGGIARLIKSISSIFCRKRL